MPFNSKYLWISVFNSVVFCFALAHRPSEVILHFLTWLHLPLAFFRFYVLPDYVWARTYLYLAINLILFPSIIGFLSKARFSKYQKKLDLIKLGDEIHKPKVIGIIPEETLKTLVKIKSPGISLDKFKGKTGDLQAAFNQTVESINANENHPSIIELTISKYPLPKLVHYEEHELDLKNEGDFMIGQSRQGFMVQNISDLPHLLIAGTTGSGKSTFFKQLLIGLMSSSPEAEFYLLDLKQGAEFGTFKGIHGVKISKTIEPSLAYLRDVSATMHKRFEFLESKELTKIIPDEHNIPRIIIAIDEASELISVPSRSHPSREAMLEARQIVNDIAKLGRAAAINLIIATQKVHKSIIDTSLQENLGGRMAFRMATLANSAQVLGSKEANNLSENKGRARWLYGTKNYEVQAPYIEERKMKSSLEKVKELRGAFAKPTKLNNENLKSPELV